MAGFITCKVFQSQMDAVMKKEMKVVEEEKFQLMRVSEEEKRMEGFLFETFILHCMQTHSKN